MELKKESSRGGGMGAKRKGRGGEREEAGLRERNEDQHKRCMGELRSRRGRREEGEGGERGGKEGGVRVRGKESRRRRSWRREERGEW